MTPAELQTVMSRRSLLRAGAVMAGAAGLAPLLSACGSDDSSGDGGSSTPGGQIDFYSWQGYELAYPAMQSFMKANDIKLKATFISDAAEVPTKFTTGGGKGLFNLSTFNAPYGPFFEDLGILEPLDMSKIPNYNSDFFPFFREGDTWSKYWNVDGKQLGIPISWAYSATNYDASQVPPPVKATDLLDDPYKGKFVLSNDSTGLIFQGALIAGIANIEGYFTPEELDQIFDVLREFKAVARRVGVAPSDIGNLYQNGEIVASLTTWPGLNTVVSGKKSADIKSILPEEGALGYCDSYFIPAGAKDTDAVYTVLNELCTPKAQRAYAEYVVTGITNSKTVPLLDQTARDLVPYDDITSFFDKAPLFGLPLDPPEGITTIADWQKAWEQFLNE